MSNSNEDISLEGWSIANRSDTFDIPANHSIYHDGFLLIAREKVNTNATTVEGIFSLNNYHDTLYLISPWGSYDSIAWDSSIARYREWSRESIHRVLGVSGFGGVVLSDPTPGFESNISPASTPFTLSISPTTFRPDRGDSLKISVTKPANYEARVRIFSSKGEEIKSWIISSRNSYWLGRDESGYRARRGAYIVVVEFYSSQSDDKLLRKGVVLWR
jgi:hypothetical protein